MVFAQDKIPYNDVTANSGAPVKSILTYNPYKRYEVWRFLTYMLLHNGYLHLVFNCSMQIVLGTLLEVVHKFWRVGLVYFLGVIAGRFLISKYIFKQIFKELLGIRWLFGQCKNYFVNLCKL